MIHIDNLKVEVKGDEAEIKTELTLLIRSLIEHGVIKNDDDMSGIYKMAKMSPEEIHKQACEILDSMDIGEAFAALMRATGSFEHE